MIKVKLTMWHKNHNSLWTYSIRPINSELSHFSLESDEAFDTAYALIESAKSSAKLFNLEITEVDEI